MKVLSAEQTRAADLFTIDNEPIASIDLMERASTAFVDSFCKRVKKTKPVSILCGTGNNGGDGLAIARLLITKGYKIDIFIIQPKDTGSKDFKINLKRLDATFITWIRTEQNIPIFSSSSVFIDGVFGSGLTRKIEGVYAKVIEQLNKSKALIYAIDVPSGLFIDEPTTGEAVVMASHTISFQVPKLSFFFPENEPYVGEWSIVDIGLSRDFINDQATNYEVFEKVDVKSLIVHRNKFSHKGTFGYGQIIAGSYGKMGASILASSAFLRSGAGLLTVTSPKSGIPILQTSLPETMVVDQPGESIITDFNVFDDVNVVGIGPGLGQDKSTLTAFKQFLQHNNHDLVIDADGINMLSNNRELLENLPQGTILTPHLKEFDRLAGPSDDNWQRIVKAQNICSERGLIIVLKGAHSAVINSNGKVSFNTTGNPGMATAGSGDVLMGVITGLRAQGLKPFDAARVGVCLHGLAGDIAAIRHSEYAMLASDIVNAIGSAYLEVLAEPFD